MHLLELRLVLLDGLLDYVVTATHALRPCQLLIDDAVIHQHIAQYLVGIVGLTHVSHAIDGEAGASDGVWPCSSMARAKAP